MFIRKSFIVAFLLALGLAALVTPIMLRLSIRMGWCDQPDGDRKVHKRPIPRTGGVAIAVGLLAPLVGLVFWGNDFSALLQQDVRRLTGFFGGALAILGLGLYDDIKGVGAWGKLGVQCAVGVMLWLCDLRFAFVTIAGHTIDLGIWSLPLTILWLAAIINALNLIDGLDGLAAGVTVIAASSLAAIALLDGHEFLALFAIALAGSSAGFLFYNFSPALIFMGDSGSMTIGYAFATAALWSASKRSTVLALSLPIVALGLPIADTAIAFLRRALQRRSPFQSDRGHVHHKLLDSGLSDRQAVLALYAICVVLSVGAVYVRITDDLRVGAATIAIAALVFVLVRALQARQQRLRDR